VGFSGFSKEFSSLFQEFQILKSEKGINLLDFFRQKGIIFDVTKIHSNDKNTPLEDFRPTPFRGLTLIGTLLCSIPLLIIGLPILITSSADIGFAIGALLILLGGFVLINGIRKVFTKLLIYPDRLELVKPMKKQVVYWNQILNIGIRKQTRISKRKTFWGTWRETGRSDVGLILQVATANITMDIDITTYGMREGSLLAKRVIEYARHFSTKKKNIGNVNRKDSDEILDKALQALPSAFNIAFEMSVLALIFDDLNSNAWKILSLLLTEIYLDEAFLFFKEAMRINPNDPELPMYLGKLYENLGDLNTSKDLYLQALAINPEIFTEIQNNGYGIIPYLNHYKSNTFVLTDDLIGKQKVLLRQKKDQEEIKRIEILEEKISRIGVLIEGKTKVPIGILESVVNLPREEIKHIVEKHYNKIVVNGKIVDKK